jgi:multidrug efflux pump
MSLGGAVWALKMTDSTVNIFSQIGIIMLLGLVTKNAILIVEFANQERAKGLSAIDAAVLAGAERYRPILMTSLATILGVSPIALALGASSGSRQSLGIAVVGGMLGATFLSLYLVPALYVLFSRLKRGRGEPPPEPSQPAADNPGIIAEV